MKKVTYNTSDGINLVGIWDVPKTRTNSVVILTHGITVDKDENGLFVKLSKTLVDNGFSVFRFDFRCHGESSGKQTNFSVKGQLEDLKTVSNEIDKLGYKNIYLLGASFGGGASVLFTSNNQNKVKALCLWNPVLDYDHTFLHPTLPWLKDKIVKMREELKSKGETELGRAKYHISFNLFKEMASLRPYEELKKITIPVLIIHGTKDTKVLYEDSKEYVKNLKNGYLFTILNAEHGFHGDGEYKIAEKETMKFLKSQ